MNRPIPLQTDIAELLEVKPPDFAWPKFLCPHCCAIHYQRPMHGHNRCQNSICHKQFPDHKDHWVDEQLSYPNDRYYVDFADPVVQATKLAQIKAVNDVFQAEYMEFQSNMTMRGQLKGEELKEFQANAEVYPWHYPLKYSPRAGHCTQPSPRPNNSSTS